MASEIPTPTLLPGFALRSPFLFFFFLGFSKFFSPLSFKVRMFRSFSRAFVLCLLSLAVKFGVNVGIFWCCYWLVGSSVLD